MTTQTTIPSDQDWREIQRKFLTSNMDTIPTLEEWADILDRYLSADRLNDGEDWVEAQAVMMGTPAPDLQALSHKLDVVMSFEDEEEDEPLSMIPWTPGYLAQTARDYRRLLSPGPLAETA